MSRFSAFNGMLNRPHMAHINNTLAKKQLIENAGDADGAYGRYRKLVVDFLGRGFTPKELIEELEYEITRIEEDEREGDPLFLEGVQASKKSCIDAIRRLISELRDGKYA